MLLSLIIPTHQRVFQVEKLLKSISKQDFPPEKMEVLLISNFKDKLLRMRILDWEKTFLNFKYKEVGLKSVNKARNMGIRFARGDILYFLDDDCFLPHEQHLKNIFQAHEKHSEVAGIGGPYKIGENLRGMEKFYHESSELWLDTASQTDHQSSQLLGGNASYKSFVFDMGYYFDPTIVFGGSEESFNSSIKKYGLIRDKNLWVYHHPQLKGFAFIKKSFKQGVGAFKNQSKNLEESFDSKWAFLHGDKQSFYSFLYQFFFKMGYFWESSSSQKGGLFFKSFRFLFLILKSRWYFLKNFFVHWFYGKVLSRGFGRVWYYVGWFYGKVLSRLIGVLWEALGKLWYVLGWVYGKVLSRGFGRVWYYVGWFYGKVLSRLIGVLWEALGKLWYVLGWVYGKVLSRGFGRVWYYVGWFYGKVLSRLIGVLWEALGKLWYVLGWVYGKVLSRGFGRVWYYVGWFYGKVLSRLIGVLWEALGKLWYVLGWVYGKVLSRGFGRVWYYVGWFYGKVLLFLFHHSPPMKIYYFSQYQYKKRIRPFFNKRRLKRVGS